MACTTRKRIAYRDFYDVYFYLKKGIIPSEAIIKNVSGKNTPDYLKELVAFINKNITNQSVLHGVGELINNRQKDFIRQQFKTELLVELDFMQKSL